MATFKLQAPHSPGQRILIESTSMDVCFAGRRFGKTHAGTHRLLKAAFTVPDSINWWVGLSSKAASYQHAWSELKKHHEGIMKKLKLDPREWRSYVTNELRFPNGSAIQMKTAENPESLAGAAVDAFVFDEFTMARERVWTEQLAPTMITTGGHGLFIGVPKGNNWATKLWRYAKPADGWNQLSFKTLDNPMIKLANYEIMRESMPLLMQQQELQAEIIAGRGLVFRNIIECTGAPWQESPAPRSVYVAGLDWGKQNDYTVLTVIDVLKRECIYYDRFNAMDYPAQLERIRKQQGIWGFQRIIAESNAMGGPLCDQLARDGLPIEPFDMNQTSKREIIELLQVAFETETFKIPSDELLIDELETMEMNLTKTGFPQYGAPSGLHDDLCMSLALAHWGIAYNYRI